MDKQFDVTSVGSTMIRLSVPPGERLETCREYTVRTAGTESNTLTALSRMGKKTAWISRLCDNPLGRRIANDIGYYGVDASGVIWTDSDRNEVFFVEYGSNPRPTQVIYDRGHSAVASIRFEDIDLDYLLNTKILHLTGIFPALSEGCARVTERLIQAAHNASVKVSLDVNYRSKLWETKDKAVSVLQPIMENVDILFITSEDAECLYGLTGPADEIVKQMHHRFNPGISVVTLGGDGGIVYDGKISYRKAGYPVETRDRLGAGDCFAAGMLAGYLEGSLELGLEYATAMAALKMGINGDYFVSDKKEVLALIHSGKDREVGR